MRLLESPAGQLGIEIAPHYRINQEPSKVESPHGFLTALLFDARKGKIQSSSANLGIPKWSQLMENAFIHPIGEKIYSLWQGRSYLNIPYTDDIFLSHDYLVCLNNRVGEKEEGSLPVS